MVAARTGRWALRPLALSVSSKVLPVLSFIAAGANPCGRGAEDGARRWIKRDLHGPRAESRRGSSLLAGKERNAAPCRTCAAAHAVRRCSWRALLDLRLRGAALLCERAALLDARGARVLAAELVDAAGSVDDLLFARIERMAV